MPSNGMQCKDVRDLTERGVNEAKQRSKTRFLADWRWYNDFWHVAVTIVAGVTSPVVPRLTNT
jgi:hypothetical protein